MCWRGENIPRIAQEDIKVYKIVTRDDLSYKSVYQNFFYKIGETYKEEIEVHDGFIEVTIEKGFHSYSLEKTYITTYPNDCLNCYATRVLCIYRKGEDGCFYSSNRIDWFDFVFYAHGLFCLNCTIPQGATYYENEDGEIVSDRLRVDSAEEIK